MPATPFYVILNNKILPFAIHVHLALFAYAARVAGTI